MHRGKLVHMVDTRCLAQRETTDVRDLLKLFGAEAATLQRNFDTMLQNLELKD